MAEDDESCHRPSSVTVYEGDANVSSVVISRAARSVKRSVQGPISSSLEGSCHITKESSYPVNTCHGQSTEVPAGWQRWCTLQRLP